jgi:hypothetical protein
MDAPAGLFEGLDERGGDPSKAEDAKVTADMLEGTFRFKPRGSTDTADKAKQRQDWVLGMQALPNFMKIWPAMQQGLAYNKEAAKSAIEQWIRLFNIPDKQAWTAWFDMPGAFMPPPPIDPMTGQPMVMPQGMPGMPPGMPPPGMMPPGMAPPMGPG